MQQRRRYGFYQVEFVEMSNRKWMNLNWYCAVDLILIDFEWQNEDSRVYYKWYVIERIRFKLLFDKDISNNLIRQCVYRISALRSE